MDISFKQKQLGSKKEGVSNEAQDSCDKEVLMGCPGDPGPVPVGPSSNRNDSPLFQPLQWLSPKAFSSTNGLGLWKAGILSRCLLSGSLAKLICFSIWTAYDGDRSVMSHAISVNHQGLWGLSLFQYQQRCPFARVADFNERRLGEGHRCFVLEMDTRMVTPAAPWFVF